MDMVLIYSGALKIGYALIALVAVAAFSLWLDRRIGVHFAELHRTIRRNPLALAIYQGARWIGICLLVGLLIGCATAQAVTIPHTYDRQIRHSAEHWWPGLDWRFLKAQLFQESRLDPTARSGAGAEGIAQFMPQTWIDISRQLGYATVARQAAGPAIEGAGYYMAQLKRQWPQGEFERHRLGAACYNAGCGNIKRAARMCGDATAAPWGAISACLPGVTGKANSAQTVGYVAAIWRWWLALQAGA